jgi:hypothetical protein
MSFISYKFYINFNVNFFLSFFVIKKNSNNCCSCFKIFHFFAICNYLQIFWILNWLVNFKFFSSKHLYLIMIFKTPNSITIPQLYYDFLCTIIFAQNVPQSTNNFNVQHCDNIYIYI